MQGVSCSSIAFKKKELNTFHALKHHHHSFFPSHLLLYLQANNGANPSIPPRPSNSYNTISLISRHIPRVRAKLTTNLSLIKGAITLLVENINLPSVIPLIIGKPIANCQRHYQTILKESGIIQLLTTDTVKEVSINIMTLYLMPNI
jgi:hypothetical protein